MIEVETHASKQISTHKRNTPLLDQSVPPSPAIQTMKQESMDLAKKRG